MGCGCSYPGFEVVRTCSAGAQVVVTVLEKDDLVDYFAHFF